MSRYKYLNNHDVWILEKNIHKIFLNFSSKIKKKIDTFKWKIGKP